MSDEHDECTESYQDCVRSRQERVRRAVEDNPEGSTRKIADAAGVSYQAVSKHRNKMVNALTTTRPVQFRPDDPAVNGLPKRPRREDWKPREPRIAEIDRWLEHYLCWTKSAQSVARMAFHNLPKGALPNAAYDDEVKPPRGRSANSKGSNQASAENGATQSDFAAHD